VDGSVPVAASPASGSVFPIGTTTVTLTATDAAGNSATKTFAVTVEYVNHDPTADAGADRTVEATGPLTNVTLVGSGTDEDGDALSYRWLEGGSVIGTSPVLSHSFALGTHTLTLEVSDGNGGVATDAVTVTVVDTTAPVISGASVSPSVLTLPNHKMADVLVSYSVQDLVDPNPSTVLLVTSNEPDEGLGDGDMPGDIEVLDNHRVRLRAERSGKGNGRVYTIKIVCTDASGNSSSVALRVTVPKGTTP
jgi:hypothetical protein